MSSTLRQRKNKTNDDEKKKESAFTKHAEKDSALKPDDTESSTTTKRKGLSVLGRIAVFLGFPAIVGFCSLYLSFMRNKTRGDGETIDLDKDFVFPFLLALSLAVVVGFQTKGFTTNQVKPLVAWPKVKRKKRIIKKRVVVDDIDYKRPQEENKVPETKKKTRKED